MDLIGAETAVRKAGEVQKEGSEMQKPTMTTEEAAEYLSLAMSTLEKMRVYGDGPRFCKLGRKVVYRVEDLDTYLEARVVRSTSEHRP